MFDPASGMPQHNPNTNSKGTMKAGKYNQAYQLAQSQNAAMLASQTAATQAQAVQ